MEKYNLKEFADMFLSRKLEDQIAINKMVIDVGANLFHKYGSINRKRSPADQDAFLLFQMTLMKSISILKIIEGNEFSSEISDLKIPRLYDPQSIHALSRIQYEAFANFNNIYVQSSNLNELNIKYYVWVSVSLNYRQKYNTERVLNYARNSDETKEFYSWANHKKESEKEEIEKYSNEIYNNPVFVNLSPKGQKYIKDKMRAYDYKLIVNGNKVNFGGWEELMKNAVPHELMDDNYNFLSSCVHPSNVSVFQFGAMYNDDTHIRSSRTAIELSNRIICFFIKDFTIYFGLEDFYDELPTKQRLIINTVNKYFREL